MKNIGNLDIRRHEQYLQDKYTRKEAPMIDYEELYVQIMYYLKDNDLAQTMGDAAMNAEEITEMVKKQVEEDLSNGTK